MLRSRTIRVLILLLLCPGAPSLSIADDHAYLGILHSHTSYSDGSGVPDDAYKQARKEGLEFLAITEHNHAIQIRPKEPRKGDEPIGGDHPLYNGPSAESLLSTAKRLTEDDKFVALYGQEFSTISSGNHANVFDVGEVIDVDSGQFDLLVDRWLPGHLDSLGKPAILQFNHPSRTLRPKEYGRGRFSSDQNWVNEMGRYARLIEVLNGPGLSKTDGRKPTVFENDFKYYLNLGFHVGPTGDQNNHYRTWGTLTNARTGIVAERLTKTSLLEAMRARHVFATEDKNLRVIVRFNFAGTPPGHPSYLAGDIIETPPPAGTKLTISYTLKDDDEPDADYEVEVFSDTVGGDDLATVVSQHSQHGNTADGHPGQITDVEYTGGAQYVYLRFTQNDEDGENERLWTAPIWFGVAPAGASSQPTAAAAAPLPAATDEANYVASKRSRVYHTDPTCRDAEHISEENKITGHAATIDRTPHKGCPK